CLKGVVDIALHVEDRHAACLGHLTNILVTVIPIALPDSYPVVVAPQDLADLFRCIPVRDLSGGTFNEGAVAAQLGDSGLEAGPRARGGEEEEHRQGLVT